MYLCQSFRSFLLSLLLIFISISAFGDDSSTGFFTLSIPKSGSHLMTKLLTMLTDRTPEYLLESDSSLETDTRFACRMEGVRKGGRFIYGHTAAGDFIVRFSKTHPEYVPIIQIRDLRDVLVSFVFFRPELLKQDMGGNPTFDEILTAVLDLGGTTHGHVIERNVKAALAWMEQPGVFVSRFEELVGSKGGGSDKQQQELIKALTVRLGIEVTDEKLNTIISQLFGTQQGPPSRTYRKGEIGSWKAYFSQDQIKLFEKYWGDYQRQLGYEL